MLVCTEVGSPPQPAPPGESQPHLSSEVVPKALLEFTLVFLRKRTGL